MATKLTYETAVRVLEYIYQNPKPTFTQILKDLEGKITRTELSRAEDTLTDLCLIDTKWAKIDYNGKKVWAHVYIPGEDLDLAHAKKGLQRLMCGA